jgi:branched-chain amino acid transport system permease protein
MGSNRGTLVGTAIVVSLNKLITYYKYAFVGILPFDIIWLNYLLLGIVTILILIYRPEGIIRETPLRTNRNAAKSNSKAG